MQVVLLDIHALVPVLIVDRNVTTKGSQSLVERLYVEVGGYVHVIAVGDSFVLSMEAVRKLVETKARKHLLQNVPVQGDMEIVVE